MFQGKRRDDVAGGLLDMARFSPGCGGGQQLGNHGCIRFAQFAQGASHLAQAFEAGS